MGNDKKILENLYKEIEKDIIETECLINKSKEGSLKKALIKQKNGYCRHLLKVEMEMKEHGFVVKKSRVKNVLYKTIKSIKSLSKNEDYKIASAAIKNSTDGIIKATRDIKNCIKDEKTVFITNSYLRFQQDNIDTFKDFL